MNTEQKSGYQVFLENLELVKIKELEEKKKEETFRLEYQAKMKIEKENQEQLEQETQIESSLKAFKEKYYDIRKYPIEKKGNLVMEVYRPKYYTNSLKKLETFLISEEKWPCDKVEFIPFTDGYSISISVKFNV